MILKVNSSILYRKLMRIVKAVPTRSVLSIIQGFLLDIKGSDNALGTMFASATNMETSMKVSIAVECHEDIKVMVDSKLLLSILKRLPEEHIDMEIDEQTFAVKIITQSGEYKISGVNGVDFPIAAEPENQDVDIKVPSSVLYRGFKKTAFAMSSDEDKLAICGVALHLDKEGMHFVATDAIKMSVYSRTDITFKTERLFIIPRHAINLLSNSLSDYDDDTVHITYSEHNVFFKSDTIMLSCRMIDQKYPDYKGIIPQKGHRELSVDRVEFKDALKRARLFADQDTFQVVLSMSQDELKITAKDMDNYNEAYEVLPCNYDMDDFSIHFDANVLEEEVSAAETISVRITMSDYNRAVIVEPEYQRANEKFLMLLMPRMPH